MLYFELVLVARRLRYGFIGRPDAGCLRLGAFLMAGFGDNRVSCCKRGCPQLPAAVERPMPLPQTYVNFGVAFQCRN